MQRRRIKVGRELAAAVALHNKANGIAKVKSVKPRYMKRAEQNQVRRELKHDAIMTKAQRSRREQFRQATLVAQRMAIATQKRTGELLKGLDPKDRMTETGIVIPGGEQTAKILIGARDAGV